MKQQRERAKVCFNVVKGFNGMWQVWAIDQEDSERSDFLYQSWDKSDAEQRAAQYQLDHMKVGGQ